MYFVHVFIFYLYSVRVFIFFHGFSVSVFRFSGDLYHSYIFLGKCSLPEQTPAIHGRSYVTFLSLFPKIFISSVEPLRYEATGKYFPRYTNINIMHFLLGCKDCVYRYPYKHLHTHTSYTQVHVFFKPTHIHTNMNTPTYTHKNKHIHTYTHAYKYAYTYPQIQKHIYT